MRIMCVVAVLAVVLAGQACLAAPAVWAPSSSTASSQQDSEQGFFSKVWFGDKSAERTPPAPTVMGAPQPISRTARVWNAITSPFSGDEAKKHPPDQPDVLSLQTASGELSPKALIVKAQVCELQRDLAGARRHLGQALAKNPGDPATLREIGHFEDRQGRLDVAEQMYRRAVAATPLDAALLNDLALCCARRGELQQSATLLSDAIRLRPEKTLYRNNIAKVLIEVGQTDAALRHLAAAHPPAVAQYNLGHLLQAKGDLSGAAKCYQQAVSIDPQLTAAHKALAGLSPATTTVQVAAAPRSAHHDPSPAATVQPPSEPWAPESEADDEDAPLLLPPARE